MLSANPARRLPHHCRTTAWRSSLTCFAVRLRYFGVVTFITFGHNFIQSAIAEFHKIVVHLFVCRKSNGLK